MRLTFLRRAHGALVSWSRAGKARANKSMGAAVIAVQLFERLRFCLRHRLAEGELLPFTYVASASSTGNENIRRVCNNGRCGGSFYVSYGAQNYRCPHCDFAQ